MIGGDIAPLARYASRDEGHLECDWRESPYRFEHDGHWNELGNRLAVCLDERLRWEERRQAERGAREGSHCMDRRTSNEGMLMDDSASSRPASSFKTPSDQSPLPFGSPIGMLMS